jgi:hypothetical protein
MLFSAAKFFWLSTHTEQGDIMKLVGIIFFLALGPLGCKTVHYQPDEVLNRQNSITSLKDRVDLAEANEIHVLAPDQFAKAKELLEKGCEGSASQ